MDNIFFYDINPERIKKILPKLFFDPQISPKIKIIENSKSLFNKISGNNDPILFFINGKLSDADRVILNIINSRIEDLRVSLISHESNAMMAWEHELFDFKKFPISARDIHDSYNKYIRSMGLVKNFIPLKTSEGLFKIPVKNISFLKADGGYTFIYRNTGEKKILIGHKLKKFENLLMGSRIMKRIHKTYIINISNIRSINENEVSFYGNSEVLSPVSRELGRRIRKEILKR